MAFVVCWTTPGTTLPTGTPVLSFLPPADEERLAAAVGASLKRGRAVSADARRRARRLYLEAVASFAAIRGASGRSLREELAGADGLSRWWLHPVSFKDCEGDPIFERLLELEAIREVAGGAAELELWGAPAGITQALSASFRVVSRGRTRQPCLPPLAAGLAARAYFALKTMLRVAAASWVKPPQGRFDVAILAFWDWSVSAGPDGALRDRYLGSAPDQLALGGSVGWFAWPDPEGRRDDAACAPVPSGGRVDLLTRRLDFGDVLEACFNFSPLSSWLRREAGSAAFLRDGWDLGALFEPRLLRGFADASLPRAELLHLAARRAAAEHRPLAVMSFLETHPLARAVFAGVRAGAPGALAVAVQHASLAPDKTFYFYEPSELTGPLPVPTADLVCAMGGLGAECFAASSPSVVETGTPRYDWLAAGTPRPARAPGPWRVLIACGQDPRAEAELVEAAVLSAESLPLELIVRNHPFSRTSAQPRLAIFSERYRVSTRTLAEDLAQADLVLFTHSTVAEEAVLAGVPAWQWARLGPDFSALATETRVPKFGSVAGLRDALAAFTPGAGLPDEAERRRLEGRLFHRLDGHSGARTAAAVASAIGRKIL